MARVVAATGLLAAAAQRSVRGGLSLGLPHDDARMKKSDRIAAAIAGASWGGFIAWFGMSSVPYLMARDFSWPWRAARALLQGHDPYQVVSATGDYPFNVGLFYPLPAAVLALPVAPLMPAVAGAIFV